jgi:hypothetical protein
MNKANALTWYFQCFPVYHPSKDLLYKIFNNFLFQSVVGLFTLLYSIIGVNIQIIFA